MKEDQEYCNHQTMCMSFKHGKLYMRMASFSWHSAAFHMYPCGMPDKLVMHEKLLCVLTLLTIKQVAS